METKVSTSEILRTKLHRPSVPRDYLHRPRLIERLSQDIDRRLSLVSAPAGYGKSTLLSSWVNGQGILHAWLSLDENDSDTALFLTYFIAAVHTIFPKAMKKSLSLLDTATVPKVPIIGNCLVTDLDQIEEPFVLILDDYHLIDNDEIHRLVSAIIETPGLSIHLSVASRKDPPISLPTYRAKGWITEFRANDLRFSMAEAAAFMEKCVGRPVAESALVLFGDKTEGWVTALRLAALTVRDNPDLERTISELPEDNQYVTDYIVHEIISQQPPEMQKYLLRTALLKRFCTPLCDALCVPGELQDNCKTGGREFIRWLIRTNLFIIPLDTHNRWFRFHHLFQQMLCRQLLKKTSESDIRKIHQRAGDWFSEKGLPDEALHHRLEAEDFSGAGQIVAGSRHEMMNQERWHRLNQWMKKLPPTIVENNIELLLTKAWLYENRLRYPELVDVVKRIESLRDLLEPSKNLDDRVAGEYHALKAASCYLNGNGTSAVAHARKSTQNIPESHSSELAFALLVLAFGLQMEGDGIEGRELLTNSLAQADRHVRTYHARLLFGLCFLDWVESNMYGVQQTAEQVILFGRNHSLLESLSFGHYFMGLALYHLDDLPGALPHLQIAAEKGKLSNINTFTHASYLLALTHLAMGKPETAKEVTEALTAFALTNHNAILLKECKAFQAELALRQDRLSIARHWAKTYDPLPLNPVLRYYTPSLTLLKVQMAVDESTSQEKAIKLVQSLIAYYTATNNTRVLIEVLVHEALLHQKLEHTQEARASLQHAVKFARPGGNRRPFVEIGQPIADLFLQIYPDGHKDSFIGGILEAISKRVSDPSQISPRHLNRSQESVLEIQLSSREIEVLTHIAQHMRDKEIASKLHISPATVRRHCSNIFKKLKVKNRGEAVKRAQFIGML